MKAMFAIVFMGLLAGCQTSSQLVTYTGGDGSSCEKAVLINEVKLRETGRMAERVWVEQRYPGNRDAKESNLTLGGRHYDVVEVATTSGETQKVYFDSTDWFRK